VFQLPIINAVLVRVGPVVGRLIERSLFKRSFFSVGFHDLEFATHEDMDGLPVGSLTRPNLGLPLDVRFNLVRETVEKARRTHQFVLMREVSQLYR
jgi:hypothetical protein